MGTQVTRANALRLTGLLTYVLAACTAVYIFRPVYLFSMIIVLVPPAVVNWSWLRRARRRVLIFASVTTAIFAPPIELVSRLADAWDVQSVLPRPFGVMPLENLIFAFLNFFWVLSFHEYFVNQDPERPIAGRFRVLVALYLFLFLSVFTIFAIDPTVVAVDYAWMALPVLVIPSVLIFVSRPGLLKKTVLTTVFFAAVFFIYEFVSLCVGSWWWPGEYLIPLRLCGQVFPLDDAVIWYMLSTPALIAGYEYFTADQVRPDQSRRRHRSESPPSDGGLAASV